MPGYRSAKLLKHVAHPKRPTVLPKVHSCRVPPATDCCPTASLQPLSNTWPTALRTRSMGGRLRWSLQEVRQQETAPTGKPATAHTRAHLKRPDVGGTAHLLLLPHPHELHHQHVLVALESVNLILHATKCTQLRTTAAVWQPSRKAGMTSRLMAMQLQTQGAGAPSWSGSWEAPVLRARFMLGLLRLHIWLEGECSSQAVVSA